MTHPTPMNNNNTLAGKVALITGGAKRVGQAIALHLAKHGMDIAITYKTNEASANQTAQQIQAMGRQAVTIKVDLAQPDAADQVYDALIKKFDRLDALVNNAAGFGPGRIGEITAADFDHYMALNARAPLMLIQKFAPLLAAHAQPDDPSSMGRVVNLIDAHVLGQSPQGYAPYSASKAALMQITTTTALELAPSVTVNAIAPGVVAWADTFTPQQREQYLRRVPLARSGTPQDVATAALYLIRDAHYCTGQIIWLDGGRLLT